MRTLVKLIKAALIILTFLAAISVARGIAIEKGPYLQNVTTNSIVICWVTDVDSTGVVKYGKTPNLGLEVSEPPITKYHQVGLTGLETNTKYYYQVTSGDVRSSPASFYTTADKNTPFSFVVYGDTRSRHEEHQKVVNRIKALKPRFVVNTGDLVASGKEMADWDYFFRISQPLLSDVPIYPALGNHEDDAKAYFDFFALPGNEHWYSFDYGNSHFIILDSNKPYLTDKSQVDWLMKDLAGHREAAFTFVFFHHPMYTCTQTPERRWDSLAVREVFGHILEEYEVDIVFYGHDHNYQHNYVNGLHHIVTGGGGAPLYEVLPRHFTLKAQAVCHCIKVTVNGYNLQVEVFLPDGRLLDSFKLTSALVRKAEAAAAAN